MADEHLVLVKHDKKPRVIAHGNKTKCLKEFDDYVLQDDEEVVFMEDIGADKIHRVATKRRMK